MTTCLRTFALHGLHPKLTMMKAKGMPSKSIASATAPSAFLNEFLEPSTPNRTRRCKSISDLSMVTWTETRHLMPVSQLPTSSSSATEFCLHSYDPRMHMISTKALSLSADDIIVQSSTSRNLAQEDDIYRDCLSSVDILPYSIGSWHRDCTPLSDFEKSMILSSSSSSSPSESKSTGNDPMSKPTDEHIEKIFLKLSDDLPKFFIGSMDYSIYHKNIMFQNNINGFVARGLPMYIRQMSMLRIIGHLKFAHVKLEVLKITKHPEDGTVRVRWRIQGTPGMKALLQFWKYRTWRFREMISLKLDWYDAFSTFYVGGDGLVHKHVCDKMMPDEEKLLKVSNTNLAAKLAFMLGAIPRPSVDDLGSMIAAFSRLQDLPIFEMNLEKAGDSSSTITNPNTDSFH